VPQGDRVAFIGKRENAEIASSMSSRPMAAARQVNKIATGVKRSRDAGRQALSASHGCGPTQGMKARIAGTWNSPATRKRLCHQ
jgi:hypothetical protein